MAARINQFQWLLVIFFLLRSHSFCFAQDQPAKNENPASTDRDDHEKQIQTLIQQLTEIKKICWEMSSTFSGRGFAPVPEFGSLLNVDSKNHELKLLEAFTILVDLGPEALPYLLKSLDDKTPTKLKLEHDGSFGGMFYGTRPAVRWVAGEVEFVQDLIQSNMEADIAQYIDLSPEFIAKAKIAMPKPRELGVLMLPRTYHEFNPQNPLEKKILDPVRQNFFKPKAKAEIAEFRDSRLTEYTVTVGDVCYVIIGQITNRSFLAVQYQPTSCIYIHSPTHDAQIAKDILAAWTSENPSEMLFESLKTDLHSNVSYQPGAVLRLGYYYPDKSEKLLLDLLTHIEAPLEGGEFERSKKSYEYSELLENLVLVKNQKIRQRTLRILKTTTNVDHFLTLQKAYGKEYDQLVLKRTTQLLLTLPDKTDDGSGKYLLRMMGERFPAEAKQMYQKFVKSQSQYRREMVINALWGDALAPEVLAPLLQDERFLENGERVCDLAAEAIERSKPKEPISPEEMTRRGREEFQNRVNQQKKSEDAQENQFDAIHSKFIEQIRNQVRPQKKQPDSDDNP